MNAKTALTLSAAVLAAFASASVANASIVYNNTTTALGSFSDQGNATVGDQVTLAGTDRTVTDFKFEYFLSAAPSGNEKGTLQFYANDGGGGKPGTLLYDSGNFNLTAGSHQISVTGISQAVDNSFTWAVSFSGLEGAEKAGLLFYDAPSVGSSFDDFWSNSGGTWQLLNTPGLKDNFSAQITAVPEPGTLALLGTGLAGLVVAYRRRQA